MPTYIDFHDATQSVFSSVEHIRKLYWMKTRTGQTRWQLTMRPYSMPDLGLLYQHAEELKQSDWPNSKLEELRAACFETPRVLYHTLISMLSRVNEKQHDALWNALKDFHSEYLLSFFLNQRTAAKQNGDKEEQSLMLVDLLELVSYLAKERA
jgi:hypothetical protein